MLRKGVKSYKIKETLQNKYIDGKDKQYDDTKERMELEKIADKLFGQSHI